MMNLSRRDFVKTAAVFGGLALTGCGGSKGGSDAPAPAADFALVKEGTLIVASDLDFEPLGFLKNGKPAGFDVDLSNEIAKRLGLTCEYLEPQVFDDIIPLIKKGGTADIGVSAFSITDDRRKEIDFTDPYLDSGLAIAVKKTLGIVGTEESNEGDFSYDVDYELLACDPDYAEDCLHSLIAVAYAEGTKPTAAERMFLTMAAKALGITKDSLEEWLPDSAG